MYFKIISQMNKQLGQIDKWLEAADVYAKSKKFEVDVFVDARLSPDQFAFSRQIQSTCDAAKLGASRLTGKEAPSIPDTEKTVAELRARIATTRAYLDTFTAKDFEGAATRSVTQPRWEGKTLSGEDYFVEHVIPNFYFHLAHTYAILRHGGVPVGKRDYLGALSFRAPV